MTEPSAPQPGPSAASAGVGSGPGQPQGWPGPWMARIYLALAVAGAVLPWLGNLEFIQTQGSPFDLGLFVTMATANPAARSLSADLAVGATAVTIWMVQESRRLGVRGITWVLLSCVTVAFAFGAPLFLYLRERRLMELTRNASLDHA